MFFLHFISNIFQNILMIASVNETVEVEIGNDTSFNFCN